MGDKIIFWLFLLSMVTTGCDDRKRDATDDGSFTCPQIENLELTRLGKPDYEDLEYYPLEKLLVSLRTGIVQFTQNDTLRLETTMSNREIENLRHLIWNIKSEDKNKIYNSEMSWSVELELRVSCESESGDFTVKSYGQNGQTPLEIKQAYRPLLRRMAKFSSEVAQ